MVQTLWMKIVKALTLFLIIGLILHGSTLFSFQEADAETQLTAAEVLEQLQAKAETLQSLQGDFEQRKFSRLLITPWSQGGDSSGSRQAVYAGRWSTLPISLW
ncbi:MAG: hypothetical protein PVH33_07755 [Syntrophobacterales bacterium]|jgi:hypothetical protein